jgi:DNA-binding CsgD family transcriptional regulator
MHPLRDGDQIRVGGTALTYFAGVDENVTEADSNSDNPAGLDLSDRERQTLALISQGLTDREIADALFIGVSTVRSHLDRIKSKTGLRRRSELTRLAIELGIID